MFILTAWGDQRELICHKESNTTHRRTPRGACQCTLCSYSPGVKSLWDDPQNTLQRSMQHAQSSPRVGMGQDTFHRQLSAPTPPWHTSEDTNRSHAVRLSIKTAYTNIQRFRLTKVALCTVCTMIKYMTTAMSEWTKGEIVLLFSRILQHSQIYVILMVMRQLAIHTMMEYSWCNTVSEAHYQEREERQTLVLVDLSVK